MNGIRRLGRIVRWLWLIMANQVNWVVCSNLWPGWNWGQDNALLSHSNRPWAKRPWLNLPGYDEDDRYDEPDPEFDWD